jgi:hypothetical protein
MSILAQQLKRLVGSVTKLGVQKVVPKNKGKNLRLAVHKH